MKAIYIHGMGSRPNLQRIDVLNKNGLDTHFLHLVYEYNLESYNILKKYCIDNEIKVLVGQSFGGFLSYWLSEDLGLPCILFNPAVSLRGKEKRKPPVQNLLSELCVVVLGEVDMEIDHKRTLLFFEKDQREGKKIITKVLPNQPHGISIDAFEEVFPWALAFVKDFYEEKKGKC